jgi:hypothetical protein
MNEEERNILREVEDRRWNTASRMHTSGFWSGLGIMASLSLLLNNEPWTFFFWFGVVFLPVLSFMAYKNWKLSKSFDDLETQGMQHLAVMSRILSEALEEVDKSKD